MTDVPAPPGYGKPEVLEPGLRRIVAPNPSAMTQVGTNTYLVGEGSVTIIDPGPPIPAHLDAIIAALGPDERINNILVTHAHRDHSSLAAPLSEATGARVLGFGTALDGRSDIMRRLGNSGLSGGGEGLDLDFTPDTRLDNDEVIAGLTAIHTPGHAANHMCFLWRDAVFSGDIVMGWASTLVSPPDGDLTLFMSSTERLARLDARVFYPGHGSPINAPRARCQWLLDHRLAREAQILAVISSARATVSEITRAVYTDTMPVMLPAAERNVFAHLIDLTQRNLIVPDPILSTDARFHAR